MFKIGNRKRNFSSLHNTLLMALKLIMTSNSGNLNASSGCRKNPSVSGKHRPILMKNPFQ
jgi:hypothetical protein